jgi:hypothetical protein
MLALIMHLNSVRQQGELLNVIFVISDKTVANVRPVLQVALSVL